MRPRLLLTRPVWQGQTDEWSQAFVLAGEAADVEVLVTPMQRLSGLSTAAQQSLVRELDESDDRSDVRSIWLIATSPASAQALERCPLVVEALRQRNHRIRLAAVGEGSAETFARELRSVGLAAEGSVEDIIHAGPAGDAEKLTEQLGELAKAGDLALPLEGIQNKPDLAQMLMSKRMRVLRLPIYSRAPDKLPALEKDERPLWILVTTSTIVKPTVLGLHQQGIDPVQARWLGHHPAIGRAVLAALPEGQFTLLPSLSPKSVLSHITLSP